MVRFLKENFKKEFFSSLTKDLNQYFEKEVEDE